MVILTLLINFIVVFVSIVLFIAPFYWLYRRRNTLSGEHSFNQTLEFFFQSKQADALVFCWAMGEAVAWFVIPEFLLLLVVFMRLQHRGRLIRYDIYGTIVGTVVALLLHLPRDKVVDLPYIQPLMLTKVDEWYSQLGIWGLVHQPFSGVPYKVFTHLANDYHFFFLWFILLAVFLRIGRYLIGYAFLQALYPFVHRYVYRHYIRLFIIAIALFSFLLLRVSQSYAH